MYKIYFCNLTVTIIPFKSEIGFCLLYDLLQQPLDKKNSKCINIYTKVCVKHKWLVQNEIQISILLCFRESSFKKIILLSKSSFITVICAIDRKTADSQN